MVRSSYILISLLGTALLTLSACTAKKAEESNTNGSSLIYVDSCKGDGRPEPVPEDAPVKISRRANISFKACMSDTLTNKSFRGQKFEIEDMATGQRYFPDPNDENADGASTRAGCIVWHEPLDFNPLGKKSVMLELKRKLIVPGVNAFAIATYYVDPWAMATNDRRNGGNSVMCGRDVARPPNAVSADEPQKQKAFLSGGDDNERDGADLSISSIHVHPLTRQRYADGQVVDYAITMKPYVTLYDGSNIPKPQDLPVGMKFAIFAHLVATDAGDNQDEKAILTMGAMSTMATVEADGQIHTTLRTNLEKTTAFGNVSMAIRIIPTGLFGGQLPLKSFEYIYELGDVREMGDKTGTPNPDCAHHNKEKCNMLNFLSDANNFKKFEAARLAYKKEPLFFSTMKLRFVTIATDPPETATRRTVTYSASTCITDTMTGGRLIKTPFSVEYVQDPSDKTPPDKDFYQKNQIFTTDDEGCLRWIAHVTHEYYKPEQFITKRVKIKMIGPNKVRLHADEYAIPVTEFDKYNPKLKDIERDLREVPRGAPLVDEPKNVEKEAAGQELKFVLNPWDDKFTFGFDLRSGEVNEKFVEDINHQKKPESRFFTGGYGYHTIRFLYDFDRYMQMQVKKTILLEVDPRVLRYSGIVNARKTTENLRDGIYLLKVGIQKSFLDPATPELSIYMQPNGKAGTECIGGEGSTLKNPKCLDRQSDPAGLEKALAKVPPREYVTTKTALVRVVDGRLIKPIELTMRDLRLMRVRANFLIELETIDEQDLAANEVVQKYYRGEIEQLNKERDSYKCNNEEKCYGQFLKEGKVPTANADYENFMKNYSARRDATAAKWKNVFKKLDEDLKSGSADDFKNQLAKLPIGQNKPEDQKTDEEKRNESQLKLDFGDDLVKALYQDFTQQKLPDCDRFDCELFVENDGIHTYPETDHRDNGLKPRTFVGPVIFLSNAYSDAVRATDNLDEVCRQENPFLLPWQLKKIDDPEDKLSRSKFESRKEDNPAPGEILPPSEDELFAIQEEPNSDIVETLPRAINPAYPDAAITSVTPNPNGPNLPAAITTVSQFIAPVRRENISYRYSPYFNALSHLCYQSFDDDPRSDENHIPHEGLKTTEKKLKQEYANRMPQVAALPNFVSQYNMDFALLNKDNVDEYKIVMPAGQQPVPTQENTITPEDIANKMSSGISSYWGLIRGDKTVRVQWKPAQVRDLLLNFDPKTATQDQTEGVCHLMVNHVMSRMGQLVKAPPSKGWSSWFADTWSSLYGENYPVDHPDRFAADLYSSCVDKMHDPTESSIALDKKLRVFETGPHYTFRGGLQMNLNVGNSFSVSRGNSRGAGADFTDLLNGFVGGAIGEMIGGPVAARYGVLAGFAIKPYSFKSSESMGDSTGTSVSAQTYLASQIAKFEVELLEYEKCRIFRLNPAMLNYKIKLPFNMPLPVLGRQQFNAETMIGPERKMENTNGESLEHLFSRGILVCEGTRTYEPRGKDSNGKDRVGKLVNEDYYYFTQHFTEGDMLDQADLLNHPWLLSLRGDRDFGAFITLINGQEDVSWKSYSKGMLGKELQVKADWPLDKLTNTYKMITPSFPGIYTEVPEGETITPFPIGNRVINVDNDQNSEVCSRKEDNACRNEEKILQPIKDPNAVKPK